MEKSSTIQKPFIHPSRAHLFQKPPVPDDTFKHTQIKHVGQTWNNRRDRQKEVQADEQLLVFGYASKIFPPDEQSAAIAKNKHMIAWNEDYRLNLLIDRYDCRASLHNLSEFDGDLWNKNYQLSDEDAKLEAHLDEERYRAMFVEELEEDIRHEEELKRLHASIAQDEPGGSKAEVGYKYEEEEESGEQYDPTEPTNDEESIQKLFSAPTALAVPKDMEIPPTEKMHAIIEKTALFVSKQGAQMEIVLKAKQANNTQFLFLQFDHYLNPYYKHMVKRIKEGKYTPGIAQEETKDKEESSSEEDSDSDGGYLHPSLFASAHKTNKPEHEEKTKPIRTVDPDHPLAKLIEKGRQANAIKQYQRMAAAVYNYYQQQGTTGTQAAVNTLEPPPLPTFMTMSGIHSATDSASPASLLGSDAVTPADSEAQQQVSGSNSALEEAPWRKDAQIVPPPPDLQEVVEEIAKKVAVEGKETEKALICKADANYTFLNPWHELHPYYQFRKMSWLRVLHPPPPPEPNVKSDDERASAEENEEDNKEDANKPVVAPISFSIKAKKEGLKKTTIAPSSTTVVLGDVPSDEDGEKDELKVEQKKSKTGRRKFTDLPPGKGSQSTEHHPVSMDEPKTPAKPPTPEPVKEEKSVEILPKNGNPAVSVVKPSSVTRAEPSLPTSTFTAVTSTGEAASISDLREKQAARRRKALLFLKAKTISESSKMLESSDASTSKIDEKSRMAAIASEDIFDLSSPAEQEANSPAVAEASPADNHNNKDENLESVPKSSSSSSSSESESYEPPQKRSRSRSRSSSRYSHLRSRDLEDMRSQTRSIISNFERLSRRADIANSSSSSGDGGEVPSAYRVDNYQKKTSARNATVRKRSKRRFEERPVKRHKRSQGERSSSKSKRSHKHSTKDKKSKKKKKKSKKTKKSKKRTRSSSSSSSSLSEMELAREVISGLYGDDSDHALQELNKLAGKALLPKNSDSESESVNLGDDTISDDRSDGEIVSD